MTTRNLDDIEMKGVLVAILLFLLCISVESVSAGSISAQIDSHDFPSGNSHRGQDQADAHVWIKNTGDVGHRFCIFYKVIDRRGRWYTAPPESVYADPGSNSRWMLPLDCLFLRMPSWAPCRADFYLYAYYDSSTGEFSDCWIKLPK